MGQLALLPAAAVWLAPSTLKVAMLMPPSPYRPADGVTWPTWRSSQRVGLYVVLVELLRTRSWSEQRVARPSLPTTPICWPAWMSWPVTTVAARM